MLILIAFLLGVFRYRFWEYWKWALLFPVWPLTVSFLLSNDGTYEYFKGLVGHLMGMAMDSGMGRTGFVLAFYGVIIMLTWVPTTYFCYKMYGAVKGRSNPCAEAQATPWLRKGFEAVVLVCAFLIYRGATNDDMPYESLPQQVSSQPPEVSADSAVIAALEKSAKEINATTPEKIDSITTLVGVSVEGRVFIYRYDVNSRSVEDDQFKEIFYKQIAPNICIKEQVRKRMNDYGVTYRHIYKFSDSSLPVTVDVSSDICQSLGK